MQGPNYIWLQYDTERWVRCTEERLLRVMCLERTGNDTQLVPRKVYVAHNFTSSRSLHQALAVFLVYSRLNLSRLSLHLPYRQLHSLFFELVYRSNTNLTHQQLLDRLQAGQRHELVEGGAGEAPRGMPTPRDQQGGKGS